MQRARTGRAPLQESSGVRGCRAVMQQVPGTGACETGWVWVHRDWGTPSPGGPEVGPVVEVIADGAGIADWREEGPSL